MYNVQIRTYHGTGETAQASVLSISFIASNRGVDVDVFVAFFMPSEQIYSIHGDSSISLWPRKVLVVLTW